MKCLSCRDAGFDCDNIAEGENENELFTKGQQHVFDVHGMSKQDFIPAFNEKIKSSIKQTSCE